MKVVHFVGCSNQRGTSALCYARFTPINPEHARWTFQPEDTTCIQCRLILYQDGILNSAELVKQR